MRLCRSHKLLRGIFFQAQYGLIFYKKKFYFFEKSIDAAKKIINLYQNNRV